MSLIMMFYKCNIKKGDKKRVNDIVTRHNYQNIIHPLLTRKQILRQMKDRYLTLPRIISFDYKRPLLPIILTCTEHKSTN